MKITNKHNLPEPVYKMLCTNYYDLKPSKDSISCSEIINPLIIKILTDRHREEIEEDAIDRVWSVWGSALHELLSKINGDWRKEERLSRVVDGITVSGKFDLFIDGTLQDYKTTSVYSIMSGGKDSWHDQANVYSWLLKGNGYKVNKMQVVAWLRDWSQGMVSRKKNYPKLPIEIVELKYMLDIDSYVPERIKMYKKLRKLPDNELPECLEKDRWHHWKTNIPLHCTRYCRVNKWCKWYQEHKEEFNESN